MIPIDSEKRITKTEFLSFLGAIALFVLFTFIIATEHDRLALAKTKQIGKEIEQGAGIYDLNCRNCHGIRGEGVGQLGPPLADNAFFTTRLGEVGWTASLHEYISLAIESGRMMGTRPIYAGNGSTAVMPPWHKRFGGPLKTFEIQYVTQFILNWEATAKGKVQLEQLQLPEPNIGDPRTIARGKEIFIAKCGTCHFFQGVTLPTNNGPELTGLATRAHTRKVGLTAEEYIEESVTIPDAFIADSKFLTEDNSSCGALISRNQLKAVGAFLLHSSP